MKSFRIVLCFILAISLVHILCISVSAITFIRGDADADGAVSVIDATTIQKVRASISVNRFDSFAADVDGDGAVTVIDATYIQKSLAHMDVAYVVGEVMTIETEPPTVPATEEMTQPQTQTPSYIPGENELPFIPNR